MRIQVLVNYGGVDTNERRILPGEYDVNDAVLFGVWRGLVERGQAVIVAYDADPDAETEPVETVERKPYIPAPDPAVWDVSKTDTPPVEMPTMTNTKSEIMDFLLDFNIEFDDSMTKAELLELLDDAGIS